MGGSEISAASKHVLPLTVYHITFFHVSNPTNQKWSFKISLTVSE